MVSHVRYRSFKELDLHDRRSTLLIVPLAVAIGLLIVEPRGVLLVVAAAYVLSAPVLYIVPGRRTDPAANENSEELDEPVG